jgi:sugar/nucleoside kinase (ribokinase family)
MKKFEIVGIGNAIVDVISTCDDSFLDLMGIEKGIMQLVEKERGETLYAAMETRTQTPGGAVANTIAGIGALGLKTGFVGKVRNDALGQFYAKSMNDTGNRISEPAYGWIGCAHIAFYDFRHTRWRTFNEYISGDFCRARFRGCSG